MNAYQPFLSDEQAARARRQPMPDHFYEMWADRQYDRLAESEGHDYERSRTGRGRKNYLGWVVCILGGMALLLAIYVKSTLGGQ